MPSTSRRPRNLSHLPCVTKNLKSLQRFLKIFFFSQEAFAILISRYPFCCGWNILWQRNLTANSASVDREGFPHAEKFMRLPAELT